MSCRHTIQKYRCPRCERSYTSLDIASFPIREFGFQCGECSEEGYDVSLQESFHSQDGALIDVKEKDQRVAAAKQMLVSPPPPSPSSLLPSCACFDAIHVNTSIYLKSAEGTCQFRWVSVRVSKSNCLLHDWSSKRAPQHVCTTFSMYHLKPVICAFAAQP